MGRGVRSHKLHGSRGTLVARAQRQLNGEPEPDAESRLEQLNQHLVTELAQDYTEEALEVLVTCMRGDPNAPEGVKRPTWSERKAAAAEVLAWGWVKPSHPSAARGPIGNDGGRGQTLQIVQIGPGDTKVAILMGGAGEENPNDADRGKIPTAAEAALATPT